MNFTWSKPMTRAHVHVVLQTSGYHRLCTYQFVTSTSHQSVWKTLFTGLVDSIYLVLQLYPLRSGLTHYLLFSRSPSDWLFLVQGPVLLVGVICVSQANTLKMIEFEQVNLHKMLSRPTNGGQQYFKWFIKQKISEKGNFERSYTWQ